MQFVDKGIQYLICDSKRRKNKVSKTLKNDKTVEMVCTAKSVRYDEFERIIFENFNELDINSLLPNEAETSKIKKQKENELARNRHELKEMESRLDYLTELLISNRDEETLERFDRENEKIKVVVAQLKEQNNKFIQDIEDLTKQHDTLNKQKERIKEVYSFLDSGKDEKERINRRFLLLHEIQNMIEWIEIHTTNKENDKYEEKELSIIKHKTSKTIDKIKIKFKTSKTLLKVIYITRDGEEVISRRRASLHK